MDRACSRQPCGAPASAPREQSTYSLRRHRCGKRLPAAEAGMASGRGRATPASTTATSRVTSPAAAPPQAAARARVPALAPRAPTRSSDQQD